MRKGLQFLYLLLVVTVVSAAEVNVSPGSVYEINVVIERPLVGTTWLGIYGTIGTVDFKPAWEYYVPRSLK